MTTNDLATIATHPTVQLCIRTWTERWAFARYYHTLQSKSIELLSLLDTIERWRTTPYGVIAKEMRA